MSAAVCTFALTLTLPADHACRPHTHPTTELVVNERISGWLHHGAQRLRFGTGSVLVYQPGVEHWITTDRPGRQVCICVTGGGAEQLPAGVMPGSPEITRSADLLRDIIDGDPRFREERLNLAAGLLALAVRRSLATTDGAMSVEEHAHRIIGERYAEDLSLTGLAKQLGLHPAWLRRRFHRRYGLSPLACLMRLRLERAKQLLATTDLIIADVGAASGFPDPAQFSRTFAQALGNPPGRWREAHRSMG